MSNPDRSSARRAAHRVPRLRRRESDERPSAPPANLRLVGQCHPDRVVRPPRLSRDGTNTDAYWRSSAASSRPASPAPDSGMRHCWRDGIPGTRLSRNEWHRHHQGGFSGFQPREFPAQRSSRVRGLKRGRSWPGTRALPAGMSMAPRLWRPKAPSCWCTTRPGPGSTSLYGRPDVLIR